MDLHSGFPLFFVSFLLSLAPSTMLPAQTPWWPAPPWTDSQEQMDLPRKRSPEVIDDWPICPTNMDRVECFYTYLDMYIRLRQEMKEEPTRTIGKRFDMNQRRYGCPDDTDMIACLRDIFLS